MGLGIWSPIELPDVVRREAVREHHAKQHRGGGRERQFAGDISAARARIDAKEARCPDLSEAERVDCLGKFGPVHRFHGGHAAAAIWAARATFWPARVMR